MKNIVARKTRSLLTILSIFIGISAIFIFASFGLGLYTYVEEVAESSGIDKFMVQAKGSGAPGLDDTFALEEGDLKAVERTKGVSDVTAWYLNPGEIEQDSVKKYVYIGGILPEKKDIRLVESVMGVEILQG